MVTNSLARWRQSPLFSFRTCSDALLESIHYWVPPGSGVRPLKKKQGTSLRVAAIVDERLYRGFRFEVDLLILTPGNWRQVLRQERIDFLIVESCWQTVTGHWYHGQSFHADHKEELLTILEHAQEQKIPTVYWNTWSHLFHSHYSAFASAFDAVFCADPHEVELLGKEGTAATLLPPAVQPVIHNGRPESLLSENGFSINVLYDGFTDVVRLGDQVRILEDIVPHGLQIVESRAQIFTNKIKDHPLLEEHFLGTVSYQDWLTTVRHSKTALFLDLTLRTSTQQQWQALETAACQVPVLHRGRLDENDIRHGIISSFENDNDLLLVIQHLLQDNNDRIKAAREQAQTIHEHHTFSDRIKKICHTVAIPYEKDHHSDNTAAEP